MADMNPEHSARDNPSADVNTHFLPDTQVIIAESSVEGLGTTRSPHPHEGTSAPIDLLPLELLLEVFKLYVDVDTPVRSLVTLILVCKPWRNIVEGTPNLWCHISGREGLNSIRKALTMAKDTPLEITYFYYQTTKTKPGAFFAEISDRISQVKSVSAYVLHASQFPAILKTTPAPRLEALHFKAQWPNVRDTNAVTLFGGERALPALKSFHVRNIPTALGSLRLAGLRSLDLRDIPITSEEELLSILTESPALEACSFHEPDFLTPSEHLQTLFRSRSKITDCESRPIRLLHLRHFTFWGNSHLVSFLYFLLSNIQVSTLRSFELGCSLRDSPASRLLNADTYHFASALKYCTATADKIEIDLFGNMGWRIRVEMISIRIHSLSAEPRYVEETLSWVFLRQDEHFKTLPTSLLIQELDRYDELIRWLSSNLRVTNLTFGAGVHRRKAGEQWNIISHLSRPVAPTSNEWALPDLEFINLYVFDEAAKSEILEMVEARHSFIRTQEDQGRGNVTLKQFREIRLHGGRNNVSEEQAPNTEFLKALEKVGRDAEIWWGGFKWLGSRT